MDLITYSLGDFLGGFPALYQRALFLPFMPMAQLPWPAPRKLTYLPTDTLQGSSSLIASASTSEGSMPRRMIKFSCSRVQVLGANRGVAGTDSVFYGAAVGVEPWIL
ncbi:hypothetical protein NDU88_001279 [Pleurodeles waltl]|uniref:Uncharacterized protein n=1 Tax=Pleurodeles waltl TaxID=8319 RepID=A0AAV7WLZ7_PLEWA|nr:hypothetical protein NDU88_001279 [Pleurodeles waltl]